MPVVSREMSVVICEMLMAHDDLSDDGGEISAGCSEIAVGSSETSGVIGEAPVGGCEMVIGHDGRRIGGREMSDVWCEMSIVRYEMGVVNECRRFESHTMGGLRD
ncbi:MAG: hypothetical protein EHM72_13045 [Calditrichaeota bacterium]|nr:MAG: hypothetical protein EHM72_13045 [Calditrichota bacterium]